MTDISTAFDIFVYKTSRNLQNRNFQYHTNFKQYTFKRIDTFFSQNIVTFTEKICKA